MKKYSIIALLLMAFLLSGCSVQDSTAANGSTQTAQGNTQQAAVEIAPVDVDLTQMSGTMVYSYVYNIVYSPQEYIGQRFKISGVSDESYWDQTDMTYRYIVVDDATACCAQGLEYVLAQNGSYPQVGENIIITGVFESYDELGETYYHIVADDIQTSLA